MKRFSGSLLAVLTLLSSPLYAAGGGMHPHERHWTFEGMKGHFDKQAIQRGYQVFKEVCSACHGVERIAFRNLQAVGFSEAEVKALASSYSIEDGPNEEGDMFTRPGRPSDRLPSPYANENQARALNNGAYPPDMSLIVKARPNGANYIHALLTGYKDAPEGMKLLAGQYYNPYYPGGKIAMPAPLSEGQVEYIDGTEATVEQMAEDVVYFLQWAAEPEMERRKSMGLKVLIFLSVMTVIFYLTKKKIWRDVH